MGDRSRVIKWYRVVLFDGDVLVSGEGDLCLTVSVWIVVLDWYFEDCAGTSCLTLNVFGLFYLMNGATALCLTVGVWIVRFDLGF